MPHRDGKYTGSLDPTCYCIVFNFLTDNEQVITAKKHLIKKAARLSQLIYF